MSPLRGISFCQTQDSHIKPTYAKLVLAEGSFRGDAVFAETSSRI